MNLQETSPVHLTHERFTPKAPVWVIAGPARRFLGIPITLFTFPHLWGVLVPMGLFVPQSPTLILNQFLRKEPSIPLLLNLLRS